MIKYTNDPSEIEQYDLQGFFVGWPSPPSVETHRKILEKSHYIWLAVEDQKVVGFINAISDQTLSAYIPLLEVLPAYKGRGIGSELVKRMFTSLEDHYMVDIVCDDDVVPFYERFNMYKANGMMIRNYNRQSGV